ncbi:MAG: hypothetical protein K2Q01_10725 [Rickettsiales bacterium]|nr:hypothetical protein [Rickettsiales bacterium]
MGEGLPTREDAQELARRLGDGTMTGAAVGGVGMAAALGMGMLKKTAGWLRWLLVPAAVVVGGLAGDAVKRDGQVFGPYGVIRTLRRKYGTPGMPEGYIAATPDAHTDALDSAVLARNGDVHTWGIKSNNMNEVILGYQEKRALDPFVEFSIAGDKRLEDPVTGLRARARGYREQFKHITDVHEREKAISIKIVKDIADTYGVYSQDTAKNLSDEERSAMGGWRSMLFGGRTVMLSNMDPGTLVCRHYAPIASVLLHEAGVENHVVSSWTGSVFRSSDGLCVERVEGEDIGGHMFVVTKQGNAIVEPTIAGKNGTRRIAYRPILNGVTVEDMVYRGRTAIVETTGDGMPAFLYGGHDGGGTHGVEDAQRRDIAAYNAQLLAQRDANVNEFKQNAGKIMMGVAQAFSTVPLVGMLVPNAPPKPPGEETPMPGK